MHVWIWYLYFWVQGCWPAYYSLREEVDRNVNLDTNHTHYILVDNGTFRKFGGEIEFRGLFEKFVSQMMTDGDESSSTKVPVVSIVVEGGPGTLDTVKAAIDNATPVVILEVSTFSLWSILFLSPESCFLYIVHQYGARK